LLHAFDPSNTCGQFRTEQVGICSLIGQPPHRCEPLIDGSGSQSERFQVKTKPKDYSSVQGKSRFGTIPGDELLHGELVVSSGTWRTKTVEYRRFRLIQIREPQNDSAVGWLLFLLAHTNGLHTVGMHNLARTLVKPRLPSKYA